MKLATLAVFAIAAVATVSAADQPSLRTVNTPVEAAPAAAKTPAGNDKKEQCGGWGGGWGGMGCGGWGGAGVAGDVRGVAGAGKRPRERLGKTFIPKRRSDRRNSEMVRFSKSSNPPGIRSQ
ncbi:hypothetical protein PR001_g28361 [Phytophthora rubi]|uniref:RxLR effector protein n=1 Tax=Phytophthora rubi TaxID=129364 RepID=A0A6A3HCG2_9STRA|nr:hypothetical protein PR001_g28361 [Phytophthora rubi]